MGSLDPLKVKGKIVACLHGINARVEKGEAVRMAGGLGMILCNAPVNGNEVVADSHVLPATQLNAIDGAEVLDYIKSTVFPVAYISLARTEWHTKPVPVMTSFSSRGPNSLNPDILKPDIIAPGLNILATYSMAASPTGLTFDNRHVPFNVDSGTSMSCLHVVGIVALLKGAHHHWSPAAIKSVIMTTAQRSKPSTAILLNRYLSSFRKIQLFAAITILLVLLPFLMPYAHSFQSDNNVQGLNAMMHSQMEGSLKIELQSFQKDINP